MFKKHHIALVIPALNEQETIGNVVAAIDRQLVDDVVVADNGSADQTVQRAELAGATVVHEPRRGYGSACQTGIRAVPHADIYVFMDGDGSDDSDQIPELLDALCGQDADVVIGSRILGACEPGALTATQRFGSLLTGSLLRLFWGERCTDLGPFRAITSDALKRLAMCDPDYGWTIEMQVKAAQHKMKVVEIPAHYRCRRGGDSKVSGSIVGSYRAGQRILSYVFQAKGEELWASGQRYASRWRRGC